MKKWIQQNKIILVGAIIGAILGFLYYYFIGCSSGSCAITSKPVNSSIYGAVLGGLTISLFKKEKREV